MTELAVEARNLQVFRGDREVISSSTFSFPRGSIVAVIGPNGSGKSSLLDAVVGLLETRADTWSVLGTSPEKARQQTSYVLQHVNLAPGVPLTVREVVSMGRWSQRGFLGRLRGDDKRKIATALEYLGVSDLANRQVTQLSGGQRQRVFVAQAVAQDHTLLLLDEPLTGLDIPSAKIIDDLIHAEPERGCTVVFTTHDLEEAGAADYVLLLAGRVVAAGSPEETLTPQNLAEAYGLGVLHPEQRGATHILDGGHEPDGHSLDGGHG